MYIYIYISAKHFFEKRKLFLLKIAKPTCITTKIAEERTAWREKKIRNFLSGTLIHSHFIKTVLFTSACIGRGEGNLQLFCEVYNESSSQLQRTSSYRTLAVPHVALDISFSGSSLCVLLFVCVYDAGVSVDVCDCM